MELSSFVMVRQAHHERGGKTFLSVRPELVEGYERLLTIILV